MSLKYPKGMAPGDTIVDLFDRTKQFGQPNNIGVYVRQPEDVDINGAIERLAIFALANPGERTMQELHEELCSLNPVMEFMLRITWEEPEPYTLELRLSEVQAITVVHSIVEIFQTTEAMKALSMYAHSLGELLYSTPYVGVQEHE